MPKRWVGYGVGQWAVHLGVEGSQGVYASMCLEAHAW